RFRLRCFGRYHFALLTNQRFKFGRPQQIGTRNLDPLVTADVGRRTDAFGFEKIVEAFGRGFQSNAGESAVGKNDAGKNLAANFEAEVVAPGHVLRDIGERETEFADPVDVGHGEMIARKGLCDRSAGTSLRLVKASQM